MTTKMTMLQPGERFATLVKGEPCFWEVDTDGILNRVSPEDALTGDRDWTLNLPSTPPYLRVVFEGEANRPNYQHFWVGTEQMGSEPEGMITTQPGTALWLSNTYGNPRYRSQ